MMCIIRKMNRDDISNLLEMCCLEKDELIRINISSIVSNFYVINDDHMYIAEVKGYPIGFIYGETISSSTLLPQYMYVSENYRKQGIGRKLMQKLEDESNCSTSLIYYHKSLHDYYQKQCYENGNELEVAIKSLKSEVTP